MKRVLSVLLALCLLVGMVPIIGNAATARASGMCGNGVSWELSDDVLTISGNGRMDDWENKTGMYAPWYERTVRKVIISEGITHIGDCAFLRNYNLTDATIPDSVTSIGSYAFAHCNRLSNANIPDSIYRYWFCCIYRL